MVPRPTGSGLSARTDESSSSSNPSYKRRRVAIACKACRSRKSRCDGVRPSCSLCVEFGFPCLYLQPATGRGSKLTQNDYDERLQALEATISLLVQGKNLSPDVADAAEAGEPAEDHYDGQSQSNPALPAQQRPSGEDYATLGEDDLLCTVDGMATITDPEQPDSRYFGPSSNISFLRHTSKVATEALRTMASSSSSSRQSDDPVAQPLVSRVPSPSPTQPASEPSPIHRISANLLAVPPESCALNLIKLFFEDTGRLFPFVYEGDVLRAYATAKARKFAAVSRSFLALLNGIFAIATYVSANPDRPVDVNAAESKVFMERAQGLLFDLEPRFATLETVQAHLLLVQYSQGTQRSDCTWYLHGLTVRAAVQIGLHSKQSSEGLDPLRREIRKRTWFACFIFDRSLSMTFGCPPSIPNEQVNLDLPLSCSLESMDTEQAHPTGRASDQENVDAVDLFKYTIPLFKIQGDVITRLYHSNIEAEAKLPLSTTLGRILDIERQLADWAEHLIPQLQRRPWEFQGETSTTDTPSDLVLDRVSTILTLRFLNTRILLHRPVLENLVVSASPTAMHPPSSSYQNDKFFYDLAHQSVKASEECASEIVNIFHRVQGSPIPWWVAAYYTFNAALVVFNCILLRLRRPGQTSPGLRSIAVTTDPAYVVELISVLVRAVEALVAFGRGARATQRIQRTMTRLLQICLTIGQVHPECGPAVLSAWPGKDTQQLLSRNEGTFLNDRFMQDSTALNPDFLDADGLLPHDDLLTSETGFPHSWWEDGVNLFDDLGGLESRSTALFLG